MISQLFSNKMLATHLQKILNRSNKNSCLHQQVKKGAYLKLNLSLNLKKVIMTSLLETLQVCFFKYIRSVVGVMHRVNDRCIKT